MLGADLFIYLFIYTCLFCLFVCLPVYYKFRLEKWFNKIGINELIKFIKKNWRGKREQFFIFQHV